MPNFQPPKPYQDEIDALKKRIADFKAGRLSPADISSDWIKFANPEAALQELLDIQTAMILHEQEEAKKRKKR